MHSMKENVPKTGISKDFVSSRNKKEYMNGNPQQHTRINGRNELPVVFYFARGSRNFKSHYLEERESSSRLKKNENIASRCILQTPCPIQLHQINWCTGTVTLKVHLPAIFYGTVV